MRFGFPRSLVSPSLGLFRRQALAVIYSLHHCHSVTLGTMGSPCSPLLVLYIDQVGIKKTFSYIQFRYESLHLRNSSCPLDATGPGPKRRGCQPCVSFGEAIPAFRRRACTVPHCAAPTLFSRMIKRFLPCALRACSY